MLFSDEDLIAYLLGDASDAFAQRLHQHLLGDEDLQQRLAGLRLLLGQINASSCVFEPPADLLDTTLNRIAQSQMSPSPDSPTHSASHGPADAALPADKTAAAAELQADNLAAAELAGRRALAAQASSRRWPVRPSSGSQLSDGSAAHSGLAGQPRRRWLWDSTALTISLTMLSCLALPALIRVRFESRRAQCARNLELTGSELIAYALNHPQGRFPPVALYGRQAFAGVYALYLREAGGQLPSSQLRCPSLIGLNHPANLAQVAIPSSGQATASVMSTVANVASFSELHNLPEGELHLAQQTVGGDYAYNLGVSEGGKPRAPKYQGRSQFAILADTPVLPNVTEWQSGERLEHFVAHEGKGSNIFYEDGHVEFVTAGNLRSLNLSTADTPDNPFQNQLGAHELGVHPYDASLAPSNFPPLSN